MIINTTQLADRIRQFDDGLITAYELIVYIDEWRSEIDKVMPAIVKDHNDSLPQ